MTSTHIENTMRTGPARYALTCSVCDWARTAATYAGAVQRVHDHECSHADSKDAR